MTWLIKCALNPRFVDTSTSATPQSSRVLQLDVLRGVAILLVLGAHSPSVAAGWSGKLRPLDVFLHRFGWTGVDLFFVLSGFLIGGLLFAELERYGRLDVRRFLVRRALRIWPPYYILLTVVLIRTAMEPGGTLASAWSKTWVAFVHIQNFVECPRTQLWSLAVEEHFYLLLPLFLWLLTRKRGTTALSVVPWVAAFLSIFFLIQRFAFASSTHLDRRIPMDALFFGVNLAYLQRHKPQILASVSRHRVWLLACAGALFLPSFFAAGTLRLTLGLTGVYVAYAIVLVCFIYLEPGKWTRWPATRLVAFIGTYSYSIYLWHRDTSWGAYELTLSAGNALGLPHEITWLCHTLAYMTASVLGGVGLGWLIEAPVQRIRERLFPARTAAVSSSSGTEGRDPSPEITRPRTTAF
ncbi:MAG: acyltransferase family protein [Polyangiaceae bacterium]